MEQQNESKQLIDHLHYLLQQVNDWLKFAEAKNLGIIALNSALLVGFFSVSDKIHLSKSYISVWFIGFYVLGNFISIIVALYSVNAKISAPKVIKHNNNIPNLYFWYDLSNLTATLLVEQIRLKYGWFTANENAINLQVLDVAEQVIINASIARNKFKQFNTSLSLTLFSFISLMVGLIILFIFNK